MTHAQEHDLLELTPLDEALCKWVRNISHTHTLSTVARQRILILLGKSDHLPSASPDALSLQATA